VKKFNFDKSSLSLALIEKQKAKGTYDSPCLSVCNFNPENDQCQTCNMFKLEKTKWKSASPDEKEELALRFIKRNAQQD
jgi:predicted Fe-S protein YdhL (DUF1289 family)